jgi:hypothetical protein
MTCSIFGFNQFLNVNNNWIFLRKFRCDTYLKWFKKKVEFFLLNKRIRHNVSVQKNPGCYSWYQSMILGQIFLGWDDLIWRMSCVTYICCWILIDGWVIFFWRDKLFWTYCFYHGLCCDCFTKGVIWFGQFGVTCWRLMCHGVGFGLCCIILRVCVCLNWVPFTILIAVFP